MLKTLQRLWRDEDAPTAVEYAIMVVLVAIAIVGGATFLGTQTNTTFQNAGNQMPGQG